jgi:probable HAF family extracellular repeat protein
MRNILGYIILLITFQSLAKAQRLYTVTDLGTLGNGSSNATSINNKGVVGGNTEGIAFLYYNGAMHDIGAGSGSSVWAVNDRCEAIGSAGDPNRYYFIYKGSTIHRFPPANGTLVAMDINDSGTIVGWVTGDPTKVNTTFGFVYRDGRYTTLGTLGGNDSLAYSINRQGQIVGTSGSASGELHAFLYRNGYMKDLGALANSTTVAYSINDHGEVVGYGSIPGQNGVGHAFLYAGGVMRDLGTLTGFTSSIATGINDGGEIVGYCNGDAGAAGFLYVSGHMYDLTALLVPNTGWTIFSVGGINDAGQISVTGMGNNVAHALLLTPARRK